MWLGRYAAELGFAMRRAPKTLAHSDMHACVVVAFVYVWRAWVCGMCGCVACVGVWRVWVCGACGVCVCVCVHVLLASDARRPGLLQKI